MSSDEFEALYCNSIYNFHYLETTCSQQENNGESNGQIHSMEKKDHLLCFVTS